MVTGRPHLVHNGSQNFILLHEVNALVAANNIPLKAFLPMLQAQLVAHINAWCKFAEVCHNPGWGITLPPTYKPPDGSSIADWLRVRGVGYKWGGGGL